MAFVEIDEVIYFAIQFVSFFMLTFVGSILKEIYDTNSSPNHEFSAYKVFCGTIVGTIFSVAIQDYYFEGHGWKLMVGISFLLGLVGAEIFERLRDLELVKYILELVLNRKLPDIDKEDDDHEREVIEYKTTPKVHIHLYHEDEEDKK